MGESQAGSSLGSAQAKVEAAGGIRERDGIVVAHNTRRVCDRHPDRVGPGKIVGGFEPKGRQAIWPENRHVIGSRSRTSGGAQLRVAREKLGHKCVASTAAVHTLNPIRSRPNRKKS